MHFIHWDEHKAFSSIVVVTQVRAVMRSAPDVKLQDGNRDWHGNSLTR